MNFSVYIIVKWFRPDKPITQYPVRFWQIHYSEHVKSLPFLCAVRQAAKNHWQVTFPSIYGCKILHVIFLTCNMTTDWFALELCFIDWLFRSLCLQKVKVENETLVDALAFESFRKRSVHIVSVDFNMIMWLEKTRNGKVLDQGCLTS